MDRKEQLKKQTGEAIRAHLKPEEIKKVQKLGVMATMRAFQQVYNHLCRTCKHGVIRNPRSMTDASKFCANCWPTVKEKIEALYK